MNEPQVRDEALVKIACIYTPEPATTASARREWDQRLALLLGTVNDEDFLVAEDIQRGFTARAQAYLTFGRHEPALTHFHHAVARELRCEPTRAGFCSAT